MTSSEEHKSSVSSLRDLALGTAYPDQDIVDQLRLVADGYQQAALDELANYGEGTDDQVEMEQLADLLFIAANEITILRNKNTLLRDALRPFAAIDKDMTNRIYGRKDSAIAIVFAADTNRAARALETEE